MLLARRLSDTITGDRMWQCVDAVVTQLGVRDVVDACPRWLPVLCASLRRALYNKSVTKVMRLDWRLAPVQSRIDGEGSQRHWQWMCRHRDEW